PTPSRGVPPGPLRRRRPRERFTPQNPMRGSPAIRRVCLQGQLHAPTKGRLPRLSGSEAWEGVRTKGEQSMSPELALSLELRVDAACQSFEAAWKAVGRTGVRPRIEDCLAAAGEAERWPLLRELLKVELHYRRHESPSPDEYRRRFPEFGHLLG